MIPFVLQLILACVLIQVFLVHTDPQDSKERKKVVVTYVSARTGALSFVWKNRFSVLWETKWNGPFYLTKNAVVSVGYEMEQPSVPTGTLPKAAKWYTLIPSLFVC